MRILVLGVDHSILPPGCSITSDPGGDFEAVVASAAHIDTLSEDVPVFVLKSGGMADWAVKQKRPDVTLVSIDELQAELEKLVPNEAPPQISDLKKSLAIASYANKGGIGKTSSAINLALSLAARGVNTVIVDMDFGAPDVAGFFDVNPRRGLESLEETGVDNLLIKVRNNLWIVPGMTGPYQREMEASVLTRVVQELKNRFQTVVIDTPPAPWEKANLHNVFAMCDQVYAIVDQSKFSTQETAKYTVTLLAMGVDPSRIRIVLNRFNPKLMGIRQVEKAFAAGFKDKRNMPKVAVCIPEQWEDHVKDAYKGKSTSVEYWHKEADFLTKQLETGSAETKEVKSRWRLLPFLKRRN